MKRSRRILASRRPARKRTASLQVPNLCYLYGMALRLLFLACMLAAASLVARAQGTVADKEASLLVAETNENARKQGMVRTGKILWKCSNKRCVSAAKDEPANVVACQALAELVGPLVRFGRWAKPMPSYDLALCNVRAQIKTARAQREREQALAAKASKDAKKITRPGGEASKPATRPSDSIPPLVTQAADAQPPVAKEASPSFSMRVTHLSILGKGVLQERAAAVPQSPWLDIIVEPLEIAGRGRLREEVRGTHLTVKVEKLVVVGK